MTKEQRLEKEEEEEERVYSQTSETTPPWCPGMIKNGTVECFASSSLRS